MGAGLLPYQRLDASVDSIRLLQFDGDPEADAISCKLIHATFAKKPKYYALSYTWGSSGPVKTIKIDGHEVEIRENLYWALVNMRKIMVEPLLWVDAICINQDDLEERNRQVTLMAFIYSRAQSVLVWLGILKIHPMEMQQLTYPYERELTVKLRDVDYWKRVWIVQEVGLAKDVVFVYQYRGAPVGIGWDEFMKYLEESPVAAEEGLETLLPLKLKKQREGRHGDMNRLEQLLETFQYTDCQDVRDKLYGFLGLAHDCQNGRIKVDYSKSMLDTYKEVIAFHSNAKPLDNNLPSNIDRRMRIVKFSALLQRIFRGKVDEEIKSMPTTECKPQRYMARGLIQGRIVHLGPSYSDIVSSFDAEKRWRSSFEHFYDASADLAELRKQDESYTNRLVEMTENDVANICSFWSGIRADEKVHKLNASWCTDAPWDDDVENARILEEWARFAAIPPLDDDDNNSYSSPEPRLFLGSSVFMGLCPAGSKVGDQIVRFWDCDVAAVLRSGEPENGSSWDLVGKVDVSTRDPIENVLQTQGSIIYERYYGEGVLEIPLDLYALQKLTR